MQASERWVLGLGNPGERYRSTRHNLGFRVVDELASRLGAGSPRLECGALVAAARGVTLVRPQTYMNRSGHAARCLLERRGFEPGDLMVVYDDVNLPLGRLRMRPKGSPGGHRGMESVVHSLRTDAVPRLRIGVGPEGGFAPGEDLVEFVLEPFAADEREEAERSVERAADAVEAWLRRGIEEAMNRFNG